MQNDNSSGGAKLIEEILAKAQAAAQIIEKTKQESANSATDTAEAQGKISSALSDIAIAHDKIIELTKNIESYAVEAQKIYETSMKNASDIEKLTIDLAEYDKNASAAETSSIKTEKNIKSILETITSLQSKIESLNDTAKINSSEIQAILGQVTTSRDAVLDLHDKAKTDSKSIAGIAETAEAADARVLKYEAMLAQLQTRFEEANDRIEKLLPGATSVGLAKAFNKRKISLKSQTKWARGLFLGSIAGFLLLGFYGLSFEGITSISEFLIFVFERSPIVVGLVLLEEFGRRLYSHTLRLEEDYAYKETISLSFDGYKKALEEIDNHELKNPTNGSESLTKKLSSNVLGALNERPGRIYEEKEKDINIDTIVKTLNPTGDTTTGKVLLQLYGDLRKSIKGSALKAFLIIVLVAAFGIGAGFYFGYSNKNGVQASPNLNIELNPLSTPANSGAPNGAGTNS